MDGYVNDWNKIYMIDRYIHALLETMSEEEKNKYVYDHLFSKLSALNNLDIENEISKNHLHIILGEIE